MRFMTAGEGEIVGISWLVPPYRWSYDAKALELVRAISLDASLPARQMRDGQSSWLRADEAFRAGAGRTPCMPPRLQLLDLYGKPA